MNCLRIAEVLYSLYVSPTKKVHLKIHDPFRVFRNPSGDYAAMSTQGHSIGVTLMVL